MCLAQGHKLVPVLEVINLFFILNSAESLRLKFILLINVKKPTIFEPPRGKTNNVVSEQV